MSTEPEARLLVVEDEPNIRELLATSLRFAGDLHLEAGEAERGGEELTDVGLVLDDEEACLWCSAHGRSLSPEAGSFLTARWEQ